MAAQVREPLQVYLTDEERSNLDRLAREKGISRSEALRRGIRALAREEREGVEGVKGAPSEDRTASARVHPESLSALIRAGIVKPAVAPPGPPPPLPPDTHRYPLSQVLEWLDQDRADR